MLNALWTGEFDEGSYKEMSRYFKITRAGKNVNNTATGFLIGDTLVEALKGQDIFIIGYDPLNRDVLQRCPDLKLVMSVRDGPEDNVDIDACTALGIPVFFCGGRCMHAVTELNMAFLYLLARPTLLCNNLMFAEGWTEENREVYRKWIFAGTELYGKTLSILGFGRNGRTLAQSALGIGMKVIAYDPYANKAMAEEMGVALVEKDAALERGDYVTLLARVTPETTGMIGERELALMKPTACIINTGRPKLMDEDALCRALEQNVIRAAAMDVFSSEPLGTESPFYHIPQEKLIMTPHMAGISVERAPHQYELLMESYHKYAGGEQNVNISNPEVYDTPAFQRRGGLLLGQ